MSNPDCTAGCGFICNCGVVDYSRENELAAETTRLRQQLEIAVKALKYAAVKAESMAHMQLIFDDALAQIRELEK